MKRMAAGLLAAGLIVLGTGTTYAADPVKKCEASKNKEAGKYVACRQNAEAKLVTNSDTAGYALAITKCETKLADKWGKIEAAAVAKGATCPDAPLTGANFKTVLDENSLNITTGLAGGGLQDYPALLATALACGNGIVSAGEQCDQSNLNGDSCATQGFGGGTLACGPNCQFDTSGCYDPPRFVDNVDGTVTDKETGLMWEKKVSRGGVAVVCSSAAVCPDPHDADNTYTYSAGSPTGPAGTAFTVLLAQLNSSVFAGHSDWRLPTRAELLDILDYAATTSPAVNTAFQNGCTGSCTITTCSCTTPSLYWTSDLTAIGAGNAWTVDFNKGDVINDTRDTDYYVRAVRP